VIHRSNGKSHRAPTAAVTRLPPPAATSTNVAEVRHSVETWIAEHPVVCIAAALTLGAALGWLIKRR
jgi:hypothetical protein